MIVRKREFNLLMLNTTKKKYNQGIKLNKATKFKKQGHSYCENYWLLRLTENERAYDRENLCGSYCPVAKPTKKVISYQEKLVAILLNYLYSQRRGDLTDTCQTEFSKLYSHAPSLISFYGIKVSLFLLIFFWN